MKLIMENWRRYIGEMLNAPIKDRPALNIYPDEQTGRKMENILDQNPNLVSPEEAETLIGFLDANKQKIGKDPARDQGFMNFAERIEALLDQINNDPPEQKRSQEEIEKFREIDKAVKDIQAQIQLNLMKSRIGTADTVDSTVDFGTPERNIKTAQDFPPTN